MNLFDWTDLDHFHYVIICIETGQPYANKSMPKNMSKSYRRRCYVVFDNGNLSCHLRYFCYRHATYKFEYFGYILLIRRN